MNEYDLKKLEIKELKEKIIEFFKSDKCYDVTLSFLTKELKIEDIDFLNFCLNELVEEGWIKKSISLDHFEYDPGKKLDFGGLGG